MKNRNTLLDALLGAGLYLLDPVRDRFADRFDDLRDKADEFKGKAQDRFETATERLGRASRVIQGEDEGGISTVGAVLIGVGIGVGLGLLLAPASGEEIRSNLADKVQDFGEKVRDRFSEQQTGTYGA
jgi:hypothetical protein